MAINTPKMRARCWCSRDGLDIGERRLPRQVDESGRGRGVFAAQRGPLMPSPCTLLDLAALPAATARTDVNLDDMLSDDETAS